MNFVGKLAHVTLNKPIRVLIGGRSTRIVAFDGIADKVVRDNDTAFGSFSVSAWYPHPDDTLAEREELRNAAARSRQLDPGPVPRNLAPVGAASILHIDLANVAALVAEDES